MPVILGIDAAWTATQPSGVALVQLRDGAQPRCLAVAPSYTTFIQMAAAGTAPAATSAATGTVPDISMLLHAAAQLAGAPVSLVAVDMPMATEPFSSRRAADRAVSREFGSRNCSTHSPSAERPGPLGAGISREFQTAGYPLRTTAGEGLSAPAVLEVYPHPALLSLLERPSRVPYKVSKARKYWPGASAGERVVSLLKEYSAILNALRGRIEGIDLALPMPETVKALAHLKQLEDMLDALMCAWVGLEHLAGRTIPLGDDSAAIWVPADVVGGVTPLR